MTPGWRSVPAIRRSYILRVSSRIRMLVAIAVAVMTASVLGGVQLQRANALSAARWGTATGAEKSMVSTINHYRNQHGRRSMNIHSELERKAHDVVQWTVHGGCGTSGGVPKICHSKLAVGVRARWGWFGENV